MKIMYNQLTDKNFFHLPDGTPHLKLDSLKDVYNEDIEIYWVLSTPDQLVSLQLLVNVLRKARARRFELDLTYFGPQRMDRPISAFEPFTLKVYADALNSLNFDVVNLYCPHSYMSEALIKNCVSYPGEGFFSDWIRRVKMFTDNEFSVVCSDEGARKRFKNLLDGSCHVVEAAKTRDMNTGRLSGFKVVDGIPKETCLIIDDLCDGGGTFSGLAEVLKKQYGVKTVYLSVYHGLFTKGLPIPFIDFIYTTNSVNYDMKRSDMMDVANVVY